jgi:hypothetical protein
MENNPFALPVAQVINLSDFRKPDNPPSAEPMFEPSEDRPGLDINKIGRILEALAKMATAGTMESQRLAGHMAALAANAVAASRLQHDVDHRVFLAESIISHQHGGAEGKALKAIIKAEHHKVRQANRAARIAANREARAPKRKR